MALAASSALGCSLLAGANSAASLATLVSELNPARLVVHIEGSVEDLLVNVLGGLLEGLLHVGGGLGGGLQEDEAMFLGELLALLLGHSPPCLQIAGGKERKKERLIPQM